jgi:thioredoxin reductase
MQDSVDQVEVLIVGGGPAGLTAAAELRRLGVASVLVVERERDAGGIPRHAAHQGFGLRDLHRPVSGPEYARRLTERAHRAGAELRPGTQVTGWQAGGALQLTGPSGRSSVQATAVVLATGCRERPRSARLIPGSRPQGVLTTGMLQQLVALQGERVGARAVVVGAEHVSYSALETLARGGARTVAMSTELAHHQSFGIAALAAALRFGVRLRTRTALSAIMGRERVEAVQFTDLDTGAVETVQCDTVVLTADWIPDHELAVGARVLLDCGTRGPAVDGALRTSRPGVFAAGNVLHGAEPADVAALTGRDVAAGVTAYLSDGRWPAGRVSLSVKPPLHWIVPNSLSGDFVAPGPVPERFLLRAHEQLLDARIELWQGNRRIGAQRLPRVMPGRSAALGADWLTQVDPAGPAVQVRAGAARARAWRAKPSLPPPAG